jgi:tetrapyrrole methylase family protein / MazG family protein
MPFSDLPLILKKLKLTPSRLILIEADSLVGAYSPPFNPNDQVLIFDVQPGEQARKIKMLVEKAISKEITCQATFHQGALEKELKRIELNKDEIEQIQSKFTLYVPPSLDESSLESFQNLIAHLRSPQGCPWDREQTHQSLRPNLLEETYEVLKALDEKDSAGLMEELGDLLLQIVLHSQISNEAEEFNLSQVIQGIHKKIVHRHPHVFRDTEISDAKGVIRKWEELKSIERHENGKDADQGILESVPKIMPALSLAQEYQKRAARVGFDWPDIKPVIEKVYEELTELEEAPDQQRKEEELGDLLFAVVNLIRWHEVDAESALRKMTTRFYKRFSFIEENARQQGRRLQEMSLEEMDAIWEKAKQQGL